MTKKPQPAPSEPQPFLGTIASGVAGSLLQAGLGAAMERVAAKPGNSLTEKSAPSIALDLAKEMARDPIVVNQMNMEPPYQSRVIAGLSGASVGIVINAGVMVLRRLGFDIDDSTVAQITETISAFITVGGVLYAFYGRLATGLAPLFARFRK